MKSLWISDSGQSLPWREMPPVVFDVERNSTVPKLILQVHHALAAQ